jgi:hypothetical protein
MRVGLKNGDRILNCTVFQKDTCLVTVGRNSDCIRRRCLFLNGSFPKFFFISILVRYFHTFTLLDIVRTSRLKVRSESGEKEFNSDGIYRTACLKRSDPRS